MYKLNFTIPHDIVNRLNLFLENNEITSFSIFENAELGFSTTLDENSFPVANFFSAEIFTESREKAEEIMQIITGEFKENIKNIIISKVEQNDWVDMYIKELKPITIENFYIYNDHYKTFPEDSPLVPIKINSALAFGSGDHQTTRGCISMLSYIKFLGVAPEKILDMGCGSGILAICASKLWENEISEIVAIDIDQGAVDITIDNFETNNVRGSVVQGCDVSNYGDEYFDLILCNILKQPLEDLAESFFKVLKSNGLIITSGFIASQYEDISKHYKKVGFKNIHRIQNDDWMAVLFQKI